MSIPNQQLMQVANARGPAQRDVVGKICAVCGRNRDDKFFITDMSEYPAHLRDCPLCIDCHQRTEGGCCPPTPIPQRLQEYKNMLAAGHDPTFKYGDG